MYRIDFDRQMSCAWDIFLNMDKKSPKHIVLYFTLLNLNYRTNFTKELEVDHFVLTQFNYFNPKERNRLLTDLISFGLIESLVPGSSDYAKFKVVLKVLHPVYQYGIHSHA